MLYDRWREVARENRGELALYDAAAGRSWTFEELVRVSEEDGGPVCRVAFPQGTSAAFVIDVLRAWRTGAVLCPLEPSQVPGSFLDLPRACVHLKTTSASTGLPRVIAFTAAQLAADNDNIVATMGLRREWPNLGAISLAHSYGFSNLVLPLLLSGIPLILVHSPLPEILRRAASLVPDLTLPAVPALWRTWLETECVPPNVRLAISAGAPLSLATEQQVFDRYGLKIHNFYGSSECGGIAYDSSPQPRADASCVGSAMRNVQLSVNSDGCLTVQSQAVGMTYWADPAPNLQDGIYQTSDLARLEGGLVFLQGRQSDQINVAGRKVSPESIEQVLNGHSAVRECLVFGVPSSDLDRTEIIVACVVLTLATSTETLRQFLLSRLPAWQVPRDWWFVPSLIINQRGKLPRGEWRQKYLGRQSGKNAS